MILAIVMSVSMSIVASAENVMNFNDIIDDLTVIANNTITLETTLEDDSVIKSYKNIPAFVTEVKITMPNVSDSDIGKFLITYTEQSNAEDLPISILNETAGFMEITVQQEYMKVTENGTVSVGEAEAMSAANDDIYSDYGVAPAANWTSSDGYISIVTSYSLSKTSGTRKYYVVSAKVNWLKQPAFTLKDLICISNTATYDDSYNDYAYYKQSHSCYRNGMLCNTSNRFSEKYVNGTGQGSAVEFIYNESNGAGASVDIQGYGCSSSGNPGQHTTKMNYMEAFLRYRIICNTGNSYNIQGAYCHAEMGIGSIGLSISSKGASISFSYAGSKSEFRARPVTINA